MSVLNQSGEEQVECPLCMEPLEVDDLHFYPCTCGYQICRFCWNRIREGENGLCPACRKAYPENPADFTPLSQEQVAAIKTEKKAREQKRRNKTLESRRALANVRVVQNNLVFVVGLPVRLADPEILKRQEYFGKYGKIHKVVINQSTAYAGSQGPSASAYVTYVSPADALRAIQGVNNVSLDGRVLKGSLGTTKYCANFMKNQPCPKPDCMYLHELGDPKASFTKEEMHAGLHQVYERKLHHQLLQQQRDKPAPTPGNSSTNAEKGSSKDGNQSNFIPTTVVTSSHINVVNSTKSNKKDPANSNSNGHGNGHGNGSGSGSSSGSNGDASSSASSSNGKEAWPSLGSSPPSESPARKQPSPKPQQSTVKSQENGTSESSSPTLLQQQSQTKSKDHTADKSRSKENGTAVPAKRSKSDKKHKNNDTDDSDKYTNTSMNTSTQQQQSLFENDTQSFLSNELDELESDRHSLLENHDLLDNSDHSLLEDDNTHNLLNDGNNEALMMQRHREMLAGLVEPNHILPHMKTPLVNGYGLLDRDVSYLGNERGVSEMSQGLLEQQKELAMRARRDLLRPDARRDRRFLPLAGLPHDSASELLGANYHPNPNMLPPFGMRVDNSMGSSGLTSGALPGGLPSGGLASGAMSGGLPSGGLASGGLSGGLSSSGLSGGLASSGLSGGIPSGPLSGGMPSMPAMPGMNYMLSHQQMMQNQQVQQQALVNGFDAPQSASEGRYLAENMDKFFTDFHKAQQLRILSRGADDFRPRAPHNMLSASSLEREHKHRMNNLRSTEANGGRAAGDGDDDLDFDPFKETQKALAEMMESEMMQNTVSSGDSMERMRRARLPPPGFAARAPLHHAHHNHHNHAHNQGYNTNSAMFADWTQMDPAIMSTSVAGAGGHGGHAGAGGHSGGQQELLARFSQLGLGGRAAWAAPKLPWAGVPLPPGFAPSKPPQRPAECVDAN